MATVANVDTAIGAEVEQSKLSIDAQGPQTRTFHFKRTLQHYITNNNTSTVPAVVQRTTTPNAQPGAFRSSRYNEYRQGWFNIPFTDGSNAVTRAERDALLMDASEFRIISCGFSIKRIAFTQINVATQGSTTSITNNFVQTPVILCFKDTEGDVALSSAIVDVQTNPWVMRPLTSQPMTPSGTPRGCFAATFAQGELPEVRFLIPVASSGTIVSNPGVDFELLNGGHVDLLGPADHCTYKWVNPDQQQWTSTHGVSDQTTADDETLLLLTNHIAGQLLTNNATDITQNIKHFPEIHLLRIPPLLNSSGAIILNAEVWIEYYFSMQTRSGRYVYGRNSTNLTSSVLPTRMIPYPTNERRLYNYNILQTSPEKEKEEECQERYQPTKKRKVPE